MSRTSHRTLGRLTRWLMGAGFIGLVLAYGVLWLDSPPSLPSHSPAPVTPAVLSSGSNLARAGNCLACHTERGGLPFAGGRAITTPFGTAYSSNITPDDATGLGAWTADNFWLALHHGVGRDGRRLNPAFPYTEFTRITRADSDALFAWLRTVPPVAKANKPHELKPPYNTEWALAAWRTLFFRTGAWRDEPAQSPEWNRGAYLVNTVAHCGACHAGRNALGGRKGGDQHKNFGGGLMAGSAWYAPSLESNHEAGVGDWPVSEIVDLLRDGVAPRGRVSGPMAEVVRLGTRHLPPADLQAMAVYLKSLAPQHQTTGSSDTSRDASSETPVHAALTAAQTPAAHNPRVENGQKLYDDHCAGCHGKAGEGGVSAAGGLIVPALAGNRLMAMEPAVNLGRLVALGGFGMEGRAHLSAVSSNAASETSAMTVPFSMPGFAYVLSDDAIADLVNHMRSRWGGQAPVVSGFDISGWRGGAD